MVCGTPNPHVFCVGWETFRISCGGGGSHGVDLRTTASCYLMKKSPSSFQCYRFWLWAIAEFEVKDGDTVQEDIMAFLGDMVEQQLVEVVSH